MEEFEYFFTTEMKKDFVQDKLEELRKVGVSPYLIEGWKKQNVEKDVYGLNHQFLTLTEPEQKQILESDEQRKELLKNIQELEERIKELQAQKRSLQKQYSQVSEKICIIQGHRLSGETFYFNYPEKDHRKCFICSKLIHEKELEKNDIIIKIRKPKR